MSGKIVAVALFSHTPEKHSRKYEGSRILRPLPAIIADHETTGWPARKATGWGFPRFPVGKQQDDPCPPFESPANPKPPLVRDFHRQLRQLPEHDRAA